MDGRLLRFAAALAGCFWQRPLPGDDGRNAVMRRLVGTQTPFLRVRPEDVEKRWRALRPQTALERERREELERRAQALGAEAEEYLRRR